MALVEQWIVWLKRNIISHMVTPQTCIVWFYHQEIRLVGGGKRDFGGSTHRRYPIGEILSFCWMVFVSKTLVLLVLFEHSAVLIWSIWSKTGLQHKSDASHRLIFIKTSESGSRVSEEQQRRLLPCHFSDYSLFTKFPNMQISLKTWDEVKNRHLSHMECWLSNKWIADFCLHMLSTDDRNIIISFRIKW